MATNIEQIFRSFVVNKFKEIQEEGKLTSDNSENSQNGELTAQKEESTSESTTVCIESEGAAPTCQEETMKTENLELAKPVTKAVETDNASKELKSADLTSDDEVKKESSKKKSKKHKKHKSKKKKKKKKKEKHEKRSKSKSVSSVEDQENVGLETKPVWKPAFSSPPKEQGISDALSKAENTNTDVLSSVNTQETVSSVMEGEPKGLDVDSGFFGPKCPIELSKNVSSNSLFDAQKSPEQCETSALPTQLNNESCGPIEKPSEIAKTQQSELSLPNSLQEKSPVLNSSLDVVNSEKDSLNPNNSCESLSRSMSNSNCEKFQISNEKSRSNSRHRSRSGSLRKVPKSLETSTKSPKSRQRSNSISRDQRKQSRSSSVGQRRRSSSRSPGRRRRSRSRTERYSKTPIRIWWSKSIRNRRRSVSVVKKRGSRTRSPARRQKSRSRSTERRQRSRTRSRSANNKRGRSKSAKRRHSKSVSVSRIRRSRSYSGSRKRKSRSGSVSRRPRSGSRLAARKRRSRSGSAARKRRSRSTSAVRRQKSRTVSPARRRKSRSATPARRRSRSGSPIRRRRSRSASFTRRRKSRSTSPGKRRKSKSGSPARRRRSRSASPARRRRSRSASPARRRRSRSASPTRRRRSRSVSHARRRRSRSSSPPRRRRSRSVSPARRRRSRSASPARRRRSRSASPARRRRSRSASPARRRRSRSPSPSKRRRSSSLSRRRKSVERQYRRNSPVKRQRSRSGSGARRQSMRSTSVSRKKSISPSKTRKSPRENMSRSRSGSIILKQKSGSVERKRKSRSRSSSKVKNSELAPLNSASSTITQTNSSSSSEIINDERKLSEMTSESNNTSYLEKTDSSENLKESSSVNEEIGSCVLPSVTNQEMLDSSFKASVSNLSCTHVESNALQNDSDTSEKIMLTSTDILVEPSVHAEPTSLECPETNYEKLQNSSGDAESFNDKVFMSSQKVSTMLVEEPCDIPKPDLLSTVSLGMASTSSESEKACPTTHKDSFDMFEPTTCDQHSMDNKLKIPNEVLHSDYTSSETEGNLSYDNSVSNQNSCMTDLNISPVETVQCSDWKYFESNSFNMSDDGFKKPDSIDSPSASTVSCIEAPPEHALTQDTSASHVDKPKTELNLAHSPLHHSALTSHDASDAVVKPNLFIATNNASLESTLNNQFETPIRTLKEPLSESYSQVDANFNCSLQHGDASTPSIGLPQLETVVLLNSTEPSHATILGEQSYTILSEKTCSEQTNLDIACGNTTESFPLENDFESRKLINQNVTKTHEADSTEREHPSEAAMHQVSNTYLEVESTQAEKCISQSCEEIRMPSPKHRTESYDMFSNSQDQNNVNSRSSDLQVCLSVDENKSSSPELEHVELGGLYQSLYSSSENLEGMPAMTSTDDSGKDMFGKSQNMERSHLKDVDMQFKNDHSKIDSLSARGDDEATKIAVGPQEYVFDKGKSNSRVEAEQKSESIVPGSPICPDMFMGLSPRKKLSKAPVEQTDADIGLLGNSNEQNLDNTVKSTTASTTNDGKDFGPTLYLSIDSKDDNQSLAEKQFGLDIEADHLSHEKTGSPSTALVADTFSIKQNATAKMDFKPVSEVESNSESLSKLCKIVNLDVDVESKTKNHGQVEYASNMESLNICSKTPEAPKIFTPVVHEMQKPPPVMPLQFKFSKTFKTLATSQLCNTSDESSDKEMSKVSSLSLSTKASTSAHVESAKNSGKVPQKVLLQKLDTPLLPEALQPESSSDVGSDGKDVLQQDVIQTDDSQSNAAIKLAFPHISNPSSKLGLKQRQYRSRSVAQDSRSPSLDRRQASRSRSKSTARKRRSRSKSKKRSQSSSRKKSSHSKSSKNKRSRSKSRGRKRRSQSKSKSKKKHSPSKSSGKRKRSRSKSSEKVRSAGKRDRSRSKSKTRRKELQTKSPNSNRRSRSKSAVRKSSGSKNLDVRKASRSKSGSSRSRSRSLSVSRRHLLHSKVSLYRKASRSSSKSTSPRKRSLSRNKGRSPSRSPARRHRSRSRSRARRHRSRSRGRWRRSLSSSRKHSRSSSRTSGPLSAKKRRSVSKSPIRGHRSRSQAKQKDKSPVTKRKSISPLPQKKTIQSKAAAFKHSIGLKSLIQKQLSQAKSQGSGGKLSKEQIPLATIAARAQLPAANFSTRAPVSTPSIGPVSVPNLAEVPLPSENGNGQIPVSNVPPEQQMPITTLAPEVSLSVPDLTTSTPWHVSEMASGAQWPVPDIAAGAQWTMSDLTAGAQWPMADLGAGSHWPMHDLSVGTQWSVPDLAAGTPWAVPDVATGAQWTVPDLTASTQWTVPDLTAGSQWAMTNLAPGTQWSVPDLAAAAQWTVPDLTSGTHIHSADLAPEAQVPGSDLVSEAQVPGSDLVTEAQVPGSDLTAEAQVPRSDLVSEAQVPVPDHIPESCDNFVSEGHNLMPDVTAEALVPVASGTLVPDVAAGIPLPDVTAATPIPVPDVAATANLPVPDVATTAHSFISDYASYSTVHESVLDNSAEPCAYLDMTSAAGELLSTAQLQSEAPNRTEHLIAPESLSSTDHGLHSELPLTHATVPEMPTTLSKDQISVSFECQPTTEPSSVSNSPSFDHCLRSETSSFIESTPDQVGSGMSIHYESHSNSDCQLLPASDTDGISVNNLHVDSNPSLLQESCPSPMQSYISPNHVTLVDPYQSPDDNLLIEPYSSPDRPNLVTEFSDSVCQLLTEPDAVSDCFGLAASSVSSENSSIVKDFSHDHSHQELTEHNVDQDLHHQEPSTTLPCPEPTDCFDKPHYIEQVKTNVSPSCDISGDQNAEPDVPQLVEPYGSPEHPQLVEPYASPEQLQLVEPYASPECPQLVEPYASPEHPLLVEPYGSPDSQELHESEAGQEFSQSFATPESPQVFQSSTSLQCPQLDQLYDGPDRLQRDQTFSNVEQTSLVKLNSSPKSLNSPESPHMIQTHANLQCLDQPYVHLEHKLDETSADQKPICLKHFINSEHQHVVQAYTTTEDHQVVQSSSSSDSSQLVKLYDSPEHPQLVQPYESPEHSQLVESHGNAEQPQPSDGPDHTELALPFDCMQGSQLIQPYVTTECPQLDQPCTNSELEKPHVRPEHLQFDKSYASPEQVQTQQPYESPKNIELVQSYMHVHQPCSNSELEKPHVRPENLQLDKSNASPEQVQPCTNSELEKPHVRLEHLQFDKSNASPEQVQTKQPYESPKTIELVQSYTNSENDLLVQNVDGDGVSQLAPLNKSPEHLLLVQPCVNTDHPQQEEMYAIHERLQFEPNSSLVHPQLVESYSSSYNNQSDKPSSGPDLSLNLESPRHDIEDNCKLTQSHLSVSTFDTPLPDVKKSETLLEVSCSNVLQKQNSPKFTQPILDECCNNSSEISSEEFHNATHNSLLLNTTESPVHLFSKQDYMESEQYLSGDSDSTLLDRSASTCHQLEPDHASDFHQPPLETTSSSNEQLQLEFQYVKGDKHLEKKLSPVVDHAISDQPQTFSEPTNSEQYISSSASCLNKDNVSTDQVSDYLMKASSHSLDLENSSNTTQLLKDKYSLNSLEQPSMPLVDGAPSNAEVSLVDNVFGDSVVPSVEQSIRLTENKNLSTAEHHLLDENTEIIECDLPNKLTAPTEELSAKVYSTTDNLPQNEPLEGYSYKFSENNHSNFMSVNETPSSDCSEQSGVDTDSSKNRQIVSNSEIENILKLDVAKVENTLFSSEEVCNKPLAVVLSEETKELPTNFSLQTQEKVDSFMPVEASTLSDETCVDEVSGDNIQIDNECKITPPDLLPFDSEQPPHMCLNSESSSEPVLFISQPPPELLPYDSEQPANPFLNISDYSSEQDSSVFHTPPELLPYDSDQTTMLVSQPESCEEKQTFCEMANSSEKSSASESPPLVSPSCVDTQTTEVPSVTVTDASIISTSELLCVKNETSASLTVMHDLDLNSSEMLVEQPAAPFSDVEFEKKPPSSQSLSGDTESMLEHQMSEVTTLGQSEHSIDSQEIDDSVKSSPSVSIASIEQTSLILDTYSTSVVPSCSDKCEVDKEEKLMASQSHVATSASIKRSRSKSVSKTEICLSLSTSTKHVSPVQSAGRTARSRSRSKDRRKSRSKSITRKKRSLSKSVTHTKKSRSKSLVKTRKSRSKSATRRKRSRSVSGTRLRKSRSRSLSRKRHSRSVSRKRSSRSPSAVRRRRSRSVRRKRSRSKSVDHKRSHSHSTARRRRSRSLSIARRRHSSRSRSPVRRKRSRSSSIHRRKRSRSSSVARRRRSRSLSVTRRRRSRSSSVSRRRRSPLQTVTRRRRSPSLVRRRRSRSQSLPHRRRSRSASHRRRSRSPSASRRRRSPSAPHRRHTPSLPRRKRSSSAARKRRSHSTSVTRKRHSRSSSASRKRRSRSSSISHKRHSQTPLLACKRRSESKSPSPKSPKSKPRAQSKSERSRSRSQSNITLKRKTLSRSSSRDKSKSNEKRRKRSNSKDHYSTKQRRKSRTPPRRKKSRSPARRASPCRSPVRRRRSRSPVRRKSFSRSPVRRKRSRSRDQTMDSVRSPKRLTDLDKAQLLEIAKANAAAMCAKAGMPLPPSLKPVLTPSAPVDEKVTHRTYGVTIQELTEKCKLIAQSKEDDEVVNKPHDSDEEEDDKPFYNHPFKVSDHKPISFSLLNPSLKPAPKNQVTLTKEFPVSSGSQHRKKESDKVYGEWVPVDKKTGETIKESKDDVFTNTGPSQPVDITAAMNERAMAQTRLTGNPFDLEALLMLNRSQEQIDAWAQSTSLPGQFTGSTGAQVLTADEISNSGPQAWLKKVCSMQAARFA